MTCADSDFSAKFQSDLATRAAANPQRIVLPEPGEDRVLQAAAAVLAAGSAQIVLIGEADQIQASATDLGLDISGAEIVSPHDPERVERYAAKLTELRASKGMTLDKARETVQDVSYFGTMMILMDEADGMVSGAAHTTAHTIRPALQVIKAKPGIKLVSGAFLMVMKDHLDVYADCAVTISPDAAGLTDIALAAADTATQFGIEPKVALLSYSTGASGSGPSVEMVAQATEQVRQARPELLVDGPLQFDAAVDATVAAQKAPGSVVAGQANVFVFPDLNAGNITYKAVQRSSGALAIGPILQGLNKPVNDLSRGALVDDIVNTIIITAIQAQG